MPVIIRLFLSIIAFFCFLSCKEQYEPLAVVIDNHYLVVEGFVNTAGRTTIRLSRTVRLTDSVQIFPERGAIITAEGQNNTIFLLNDVGDGNYVSDQISFPAQSNCRVRIRTQFGQEYVSDFVPVKITPPIDSISWQRTNDGVHTYVNTHDPLKTSTYYHFEYQEDWIFHSKYNSNIEYINGNFVDRDPTINIFTCWSSEKSSRVITGTTANLESDIIKTLPITYIPYGSWKFQDKYSVMVRQYSLTKEGFEFWQDVKKNSEQLGTIFDPLPSQTVGNIHCITNPQETVIGFISAGSAVEKRIFITRAEVLPWVIPNDCEEKFVTPDSVHYYFGVLGLVPQYSQFMPPGYPASTLKCIDCRLRGSNVRPPFWQ